MKKVWLLFAVVMAITLFLVVPVSFLISYWHSNQHSGIGIGALLAQYLQLKRNPLIMPLLSCFPFLLLAGIIFFARRRGARERTCRNVALGGGSAIAFVMLWANLEYWPNFLPGVPYPGFPHGLELVIAPLFFAPVAMALGAVAGWATGRQR